MRVLGPAANKTKNHQGNPPQEPTGVEFQAHISCHASYEINFRCAKRMGKEVIGQIGKHICMSVARTGIYHVIVAAGKRERIIMDNVTP